MSETKHIFTSPGFGEKPDARGLYSEIVDVFGDEYTFHLLDFYKGQGRDRIVSSLAEQVQMLHDEIDKIPEKDEIILMAKSGGTRPVVSVDDEHRERVSKFILFVPPWHKGNESLKKNLMEWGGVEQSDGSWEIRRRNGGRFIVSSEYVNDISKLALMDQYRRLARLSKLTAIRAMEDTITPPLHVELIDGVAHIDIDGADHHFEIGDCRRRAIEALSKYAIL